METTIFLIGFMGAGKTSVGKALAQALGVPFLDLDEAIVARVGKPISQIFAQDGEPVFRKHEADTLRRLPEGAVIALGGGAPMTPEVRTWLAENGRTIFLEWPLPVLIDRIGGDPARPLAADSGQMEHLYGQRLPVYRQAADVIWCSQPPHQESVSEIVISLLPKLRAPAT